MQRVILTVQEESGIERRAWPVTRGVPLPQGAVADCADLWLEDARGRAVTLQSRPLSHWPDGSIKWVLLIFKPMWSDRRFTTCVMAAKPLALCRRIGCK